MALTEKDHVDFYTKSLRVGLIVGLISVVAAMGMGDLQTQFIIKDQPMKFAATEGIYKDTGDPASWAVVELIDTDKHEVKDNIEIPYLLSLLSYHRLNGSVKGMNTANKELHAKYDKQFGKDMNYYVPAKTLFWSFRVMAGGGMLLALIAVLGLWFSRPKKNTLLKQRWLLYVMGVATFLPFIINSAGWFVTELGRYPWTVYGLYTIADAISPTTTAGQLWFTNIVYFLLFSLLGGVMVYYSRQTLRKGPDADLETDYGTTTDPFAKEAFSK